MKVWVLGKDGLLGSSLLEVAKNNSILCEGTSRGEANITSLDSLKKFVNDFQPTHIINCAAYTDVDGAEREPQRALQVNADGPMNLGKLARQKGIKVVHISTDYVFDGSGRVPYLELDICNPIGSYGASKREGEMRLLEEHPSACIIRTSWLFGGKGKNFISSLLKLLKKEKELKVVSDQRGKPTYSIDLAEAVFQILDHSGIYHFANSEEMSRYEIAQEVFRLGKEMGIDMVCERIIPVMSAEFPTPAKRPAYSVLSTKKIESVLGRCPRPWKAAFKEFISYE